jgi:uncharacterized membrane protein YgcG
LPSARDVGTVEHISIPRRWGVRRAHLTIRLRVNAIALCLLLLPGFLVPARISGVRETTIGPASSGSWNSNVSCSATIVTISGILGPAYPSQSLQGSQYQTNGSAGGIHDKRALSPPCNIINANGQTVSAFVQVNNVTLQNYFYETRDCSTAYQPINGGGAYGETVCDSTGDDYESVSSSAFVHLEVDQDWMAKGYCGPVSNNCNNNTIAHVPLPCTIPAPCASSVRIDIQGFVYWDPEGHWEIHPVTAWKPATGSSNGGSSGGSGGSHGGSGGSNGTCSSCLGLPLLSSYLWLLVLGGGLGFLCLLSFFTLRARAKLRQARRRLGKQDET